MYRKISKGISSPPAISPTPAPIPLIRRRLACTGLLPLSHVGEIEGGLPRVGLERYLSAIHVVVLDTLDSSRDIGI